MAENRNITWYVTLKAAPDVKNPMTLQCTNQSLAWGKWGTPPPAMMTTKESTYNFEAMGARCSATGTQGQVQFVTPDQLTTIAFGFDIPYYGANSGGVNLITNGSYRVDGGQVPISGNSVSVNVIITQVK